MSWRSLNNEAAAKPEFEKLVRKKLNSAIRNFSKGILSLMFCWISSYDAAYTIISVGVQHPYHSNCLFFFLIAHGGSMMSSHLHPVPSKKSIGTTGGIEYGEDPDPSTSTAIHSKVQRVYQQVAK